MSYGRHTRSNGWHAGPSWKDEWGLIVLTVIGSGLLFLACVLWVVLVSLQNSTP